MENNYVYKKPADEILYEEMKRRSLEGEPVKRTGKRYKWNKKKFIRNMSVLLAVTVGITLAGHHVADNMKESIQKNTLYGNMFDEYLDEVFYPSMHHVNGTTSDFYLDYDNLSVYIDEAEDKDLAISLTDSAIQSQNLTNDEDQMNKIIAGTDLGVDSMDEYLQKQGSYQGYEDIDKYTSDTKDRIWREARGDTKTAELEKMQEVEKDYEDGGKSL